MVETNLPMPDLRFSVRRALLDNVTGNLAGLYAREETENIHIVACFFTEATELDREYIEDAGGYVAGDYPWGYTYSVEYKLISEIELDTVPWLFLRAEVNRYHASIPAMIDKDATTEVLLPQAKLALCLQRALIGNITGNLAGLYATLETKNIHIVACFFAKGTGLDQERIEDAARKVIGDYPPSYSYSVEYKLISEVAANTVAMQFLRAEVKNINA